MKIGELAKICGVTVKTIRFYETKKLLVPAEVDHWTGYRYYDENSVKKLSEILFLKKLGFTIKEIQNFDDNQIAIKTQSLQNQIAKLQKSIKKLSSLSKQNLGEFVMKEFVNDERVIGKWKKIGVVENKEEYYNNKIVKNNEIFPFNELYFLPNGERYWVFSWTKDNLFLNDRTLPYKIINDLLFVSVVDYKDGNVYYYAVYKKENSKAYKNNDIRIVDNINIPFVPQSEAVGFWKTVDYVRDYSNYNPQQKHCENEADLFLKCYNLSPDGTAIITFNDGCAQQIKWSKNVILNQFMETASAFEIKNINEKKYMFVEWKSGDYTFGGKVSVYYVLEKIE